MRAATDKIMADVAALLGKLRGEDPPAEPYHPAIARRKLRSDLRKLAVEQAADGSDTGADGETDQPESPDQPEATDGQPGQPGPGQTSQTGTEVPGP